MKKLIMAILVVCGSTTAYAEHSQHNNGNGHGHDGDRGHDHGGGGGSFSSAVDLSNVIDISNDIQVNTDVSSVNENTNTNTAEAESSSDSSSVALAAGGEGGASSAVVNYSNKRSAPSVAMTQPMATMQCIRGLGVGGSNSNGSLILGPQWKDGDCVAVEQFHLLFNLGLPQQAAVAYCSRKRFTKPFGSYSNCTEAMSRQLQE